VKGAKSAFHPAQIPGGCVRRLTVLLLLLQMGCYSYGPATGSTLSQGTPVRTRLNSPTDFRLTNISVNSTTELRGEVVRQSPDTLVLSVLSLRSQGGYSVPAVGETLTIPTDRIALVERRRLDPLRSALLGGAVAAVGTLLISALSTTEGGVGGGRNPPTAQ
jgi:hypothetical protein